MSELRHKYQALRDMFPGAIFNYSAARSVNIVVNGGSEPIANVTGDTLNGDGDIEGVFIGTVSANLILDGVETLSHVMLERIKDFSDKTDKVTVQEFIIAKDGADPALSDTFETGEIVVSNISTGAGHDGSYTLVFDGILIPMSPVGDQSATPSALAFGNVVENLSSQLSFILSMTKLRGDVTLTSSETQFTLSETESDFAASVVLTPDSDGNIEQEIFVNFTPDSVAAFLASISVVTEGKYNFSIELTGSGIAA